MLALITAVIAGCASDSHPTQYEAEKPALELPRYFNGTVDAWGMFQDRDGNVVKRFTVVMQCTWKNGIGTLDEHFTYTDGTQQRRVWTLKPDGPNRYIGTAPDVVGQAVGVVSGNALQWRYTLALPVNGTVYHVDFDDWMFQMDRDVMLNRATMRKFGVRLGEVTLSFRKRS